MKELRHYMNRAMACFSPTIDYELLRKKDDSCDTDIKLVEAWKQRFPTEETYEHLGYKDERTYCKTLLKELRLIPINDTTIQVIAPHLVDIAYRSNLLHQDILKGLDTRHAPSIKPEYREFFGTILRGVVPGKCRPQLKGNSSYT
jgi:hypothetical protein